MTIRTDQPYQASRAGELTLILVSILLASLLLLRNWEAIIHSCEHLTDYVLLSLSVENAKRLQALTGAYSRLELRHPGPILFYLYAVGDWLFSFIPMPMGRFRLSQYLISTGFLCIIAAAAAQLFGSRTFGALATLMTLLACVNSEGTSFGVLAEIWNPYPAILSTTCLILSGALLAQGNTRFWIPTALAFTVTAQTHLGALPVACAAFALSILPWAHHLHRGTASGSILHAIGALTIIGIAWTPVVVEALSYPNGGNLGAIVRFASSATSEQPLLPVLSLVSKHYAKFLGIEGTAAALGVLFGTYLLLWIGGDIAAPLKHLRLLVSVTCGLSVFSLTKTTGELFPYLSLYHFGISTIAVVLLLGRLPSLLARLSHEVAFYTPHSLLVLLVTLFFTQLYHESSYSLRCQTLGPSRVLAKALPRRRDEVNHLRTEHERLWHSLATLGLVLARDGRNFCVDREYWYIFDSSRVCSDNPDASQHRRVVTLFATEAGAAPSGARVVRSGPVSMYWFPRKRMVDEIGG